MRRATAKSLKRRTATLNDDTDTKRRRFPQCLISDAMNCVVVVQKKHRLGVLDGVDDVCHPVAGRFSYYT